MLCNKIRIAFTRLVCKFKRNQTNSISTSISNLSLEMESLSSNKIKMMQRLSQQVLPLNYQLKLNPNLKTGTFSGSVKINIEVKEPRSNITLHSKDLAITNVNLTRKLESVEVMKFSEVKHLEQLMIQTESDLPAGQYSLSIDFNGDLKNKIVGFYSSKIKDRVMASSKFQPTYARQAFPCFDEPNFKATFDITLVKPEGYIALSNMEEIKSVHDSETNTDMVTFATSVPMSTYLACFVVCDFEYKETEINTNGIGKNFKLRAFAQKDELHKIDFALDIGKRATEFYINYYQVPFPLPKLDMIGIPNYISGATEHWGLITFRETSFLIDEKTASASNKIQVALTIAHELAHMWFGNLVTMKWWDDIWLNEGFASYMQVKSTNSLEPTWSMLDQFLTKTVHPVLNFDAKLASHPIVQTVETPDEITAIFDTISYNKGASVLRMLEGFIGNETFRKAVKEYLTTYSFNNSVTKDFFNTLEPYLKETAGANVSRVLATWTQQKGYPVLYVTEGSADHTVKVTQKRFLIESEAKYDVNESPYKYRWYIPVTYKTNLGPNDSVLWFPDTDKNVQIELNPEDKWLKLNNDQVGFYRVNYSKKMWNELMEALQNKDPQLSISDRAQLLNDVFALANSGDLRYDLALNMSTWLSEETQLVPWEAATQVFEGLQLQLRKTDAHEYFQEFTQHLVSAQYKLQTWDQTNLTVIQSLFRKCILNLAVKSGLEDANNHVIKLFTDWLDSGAATDIPLDIREIIYYNGIKLTSEAEWEKLWKIYLATSDAQEQAKLRNALSASQNQTVLKRYLALAWDEKNVRSQDYLTLLSQIANNPEGQSVAWLEVRSRWPELVERFTLNSRYLGQLIPAVTKAFANNKRLREVEEFFALYPDAGAGAAGRQSALETINHHIKWRAQNAAVVKHWLKEYVAKLKA